VVLISHDRHLINSICNRVIGLENGAVTRYMGDWEYYIWKKERESADILQQGDPADAGDGKGGAGWGQGREAGGGSAGGESYRVRKEVRSRYRRVEKSILELEEKRDRLDAALADDRRAADHEFLQSAAEERKGVGEELTALYEEWESLVEKVEALGMEG